MSARPTFITEQTHTKDKVLIVCEKKTPFILALKAHLIQHDITVYVTAQIPQELTLYHRIYVVGPHSFVRKMHTPSIKSVCIIISTHEQRKKTYVVESKTKTIHIIGSEEYAIQQLEAILWFVTGHSSTHLLTLESPFRDLPKKQEIAPHSGAPHIALHISSRTLRIAIVVSAIVYLFGFFIPLFGATYLSYQALKQIPTLALDKAHTFELQKKPFLAFANALYAPVRPVYLLLSLGQTPEDLFYVNAVSSDLVATTDKLLTVSSHFAQLVFQPNRTAYTAQQTRLAFDQTQTLIAQIEEDSVSLYRKVPPALLNDEKKKTIEEGIARLQKAKKMLAHLPTLLGEHADQKILLLFANNMELRPGGGFIGSFGVMNVHDFGLANITIYDVYDADGQLTAHIEPPPPIRQYLNQPHWFLRDSAFFPDFTDTYKQASFFLNKEVAMGGWNGAVLVTTSAVKDMIGAFHDIYLPDYQEHITKDNFYIKTEYYSEHDFFPGSTQKKSFLSTLTKQLFSELGKANMFTLSDAIVQSFDQKNIVAYSDNPAVESTLNDLYWSGRVATPFCPTGQTNCYSDYQFALDANLGVNKANFYIDRAYAVHTAIDDTGLTTTTMTLTYKNNALSDVYPGGTYKNYFQVLLPLDARVLAVTTDGVQLASYDSQSGTNKSIGFLLTIPPQTSKTITIQYSSSFLYKKGKAIYQLVLQKQIGAFSNDVSFSLSLPQNMHLVNTNFSPLVKNSQIIYNTDLSTDRVFFIELLKE